MIKLKKRTHTTANWDRVVNETDPEAAFLVGPEGGEISEALAERLGLLGTKNASADLEDKAATALKAVKAKFSGQAEEPTPATKPAETKPSKKNR